MRDIPKVLIPTHVTLATPIRAVKTLGVNKLDLEHTHV